MVIKVERFHSTLFVNEVRHIMVQVEVQEGILEGEKVENKYGGSFYSFKGIPYAQPPVGDLRFKAPQPPKPWTGVRNAKTHGPECFQYNQITSQFIGSEDCLYLNIYTPDLKPSTPLAVMFYIHGGAFKQGNGNEEWFGPEFLLTKDVILVTINYRLEVLGFLCLDTEEVPGNAGMKDQVAALRWVKDNIKTFGGDPENITIFGMSAGGASVSYHLISPMTKGLFKRAIVQSGTSFCWWSCIDRPRERAIALARQLGCNSKDERKLNEFFKSQPVEKLINKQTPITLAEHARLDMAIYFAVVDEKQFGNSERFFHGDVIKAIQYNVHEGVDVIHGYAADEGTVGLISMRTIESFERLFEQCNNSCDFLVPKPIAMNCPMSEQIEIGQKLMKYYFNDKEVCLENIENLIRYYSMAMFVYGTVQWNKICASRRKNTLYIYKLTCKSERNLGMQVLGLDKLIGKKQFVSHGDDIFYTFPVKILGRDVNKDDNAYQYIERMTKLFTDFAKYGNPTPDNSLGVKWLPYTIEDQHYLEIGEKMVNKVQPEREEIEFWEGIFKDHLPRYVSN